MKQSIAVRLTLALVMTATLAFQVAASAGQSTRDLLMLLGYDVFLEGFADSLRRADTSALGADRSMRVAWDMAAQETFPADEMLGEIVDAISGRLTDEDVDGAQRFLESDLGRLVTQMEVDAQRPGMSEQVTAEGTAILKGLIENDQARLDAYSDMIGALGAIENEVVAAMNLNFAIYDGMSQSGKLPYQLSEQEILELVLSQRDMIRSHIQDQLYITFAFTYRDLSDSQLSAYIDFLTSDAGRAVYRAIGIAMDDVLSERARRFGARLMDLQGVEEL